MTLLETLQGKTRSAESELWRLARLEAAGASPAKADGSRLEKSLDAADRTREAFAAMVRTCEQAAALEQGDDPASIAEQIDKTAGQLRHHDRETERINAKRQQQREELERRMGELEVDHRHAADRAGQAFGMRRQYPEAFSTKGSGANINKATLIHGPERMEGVGGDVLYVDRETFNEESRRRRRVELAAQQLAIEDNESAMQRWIEKLPVDHRNPRRRIETPDSPRRPEPKPKPNSYTKAVARYPKLEADAAEVERLATRRHEHTGVRRNKSRN